MTFKTRDGQTVKIPIWVVAPLVTLLLAAATGAVTAAGLAIKQERRMTHLETFMEVKFGFRPSN